MESLLKNLLETDDKTISCNEKFEIRKIEIMNNMDSIKLDLRQNDLIYQGIVLIKELIFPIPKKEEVLFMKKMYLKYNNQLYKLNLFMEGEIDKESKLPEFIGTKKILSFESNDIVKTISDLTQISFHYNSTLFRIINILDNVTANIKSILYYNNYSKDLKQKQIKEYKLNNFLRNNK